MNTKHRHIDVIIVGAGPAGATCGYLLQKGGASCVIIEKEVFPREKLCAGGLLPHSHRLVDKIFENVKYNYNPIRKGHVYFNDKIIGNFSFKTEIRCVLRSEFDNALLDKYKEIGGETITDKVKKIEELAGKIIVTTQNGLRLSCDRLVGADGANSVVRKYLSPKWNEKIFYLEGKDSSTPEDVISAYLFDKPSKGFFFVFPSTKGNSLGLVHKKGVKATELQEKIAQTGRKCNGKIKGAFIPMFEKFKYPFHPQIHLIGDAGGYASSLTGEGIFLALETGRVAAQTILSNGDFRSNVKPYIQTVKKSKIYYHLLFSQFGKWVC